MLLIENQKCMGRQENVNEHFSYTFSNYLIPRRDSNPRQQSCTRLGPFEGRSPDWATAPRLANEHIFTCSLQLWPKVLLLFQANNSTTAPVPTKRKQNKRAAAAVAAAAVADKVGVFLTSKLITLPR